MTGQQEVHTAMRVAGSMARLRRGGDAHCHRKGSLPGKNANRQRRCDQVKERAAPRSGWQLTDPTARGGHTGKLAGRARERQADTGRGRRVAGVSLADTWPRRRC